MNVKSIGKILMIMLLDALLIVGSYALAVLIRIDFQWAEVAISYFRSWIPCMVVQLLVTSVVFFLAKDVPLHLANGQCT